MRARPAIGSDATRGSLAASIASQPWLHAGDGKLRYVLLHEIDRGFKHGMVGLMQASAIELGTHGITVNAVCPNHVTTALGHEPVSLGYRWVHQFRMDEAGLAYHMDAFSGDVSLWDRDTVPGKPLAIVPHQVDSNDMKMWTDQAFGPEQWLAHALRSFDQVLREGREGNPKMMSLGLHLRIIGRAGRIWALEQCLAHVRQHDDAWIATRHQIAQALAAVDPA